MIGFKYLSKIQIIKNKNQTILRECSTQNNLYNFKLCLTTQTSFHMKIKVILIYMFCTSLLLGKVLKAHVLIT